MKLIGPEHYRLTFNSKAFRVANREGTDRFTRLATSKLPKLYVVSKNRELVYVGITRQRMRNRLRYGFTAAGRGGYHGYPWRNKLREAALDVWYQKEASGKGMLDIETVEAEVVFLARSAGQWPRFQTEIHFHRSKKTHRNVAAAVWQTMTRKTAGSALGAAR